MKECEILGYGTFADKETGEALLRILIGIKSKSDKYVGTMVAPPVFLSYDESLEYDLKKYINKKDNFKAYYESTDNIITGKTKVSKIVIEENFNDEDNL